MSNFVAQLVSVGDNNLHAKTFESKSWTVTVIQNDYSTNTKKNEIPI